MKDTYLMTKTELSEFVQGLMAAPERTRVESLYVDAYRIGQGVLVDVETSRYLEGIGCCFPANCGKHEAVLYRCYTLGRGL